MRTIPTFAAALLLGAPHALADAGPAGAGAPVPPVALVDDYESLVKEYEAALAEFTEAYAAANPEVRREMRSDKPISRFWPRFQALSDQGNPRASFWLVENIGENRDIRSKDRGETLTPLYRKLFTEHSGVDWFPEVIESLADNASRIGDEAAVGLLTEAVEKVESKETQAAALFYTAVLVADDDAEREQEILARIEAEFANTYYGTVARARTATPADSEVGKVAPNFVARTIDGHRFALEDYRGKVVVLDFYGFW